MEKIPSKKSKKNNGDAVWQEDCTELWQQNEFLLENGVMSDCTFLVGKAPNIKRFECHKLLLAKASPVFEAMLFRPLSDTQKIDEVKVDDVEPDIFKIMLKYIYTNSFVCVDIEISFKLSCVAEYYILPSLQQLTYNNLLLTMNPSNAIQVYELSRQLSTQVAKKIEQRSRKMMIEYTDEVLAAPTFNHANHSTVLMIVQQDTLNVNEANLILACEKWAEIEIQRLHLTSDTTGLIKALGDIFDHLRFLALTVKDLDTIKDSQLISEDKKTKLRTRIDSAKLTFQFFDEFCTDECPRNLVQIVEPVFTFTDDKTNYDCSSSSCKNYSTLDGKGFIYTVKFEVDTDIALLGLHCVNFGSSASVKWSVTLTDEVNNVYNVGYIYGKSQLRFQNSFILPSNKKFNIVVMAKKGNDVKVDKNTDPKSVSIKQFAVRLPRSPVCLVDSIVYGKI